MIGKRLCLPRPYEEQKHLPPAIGSVLSCAPHLHGLTLHPNRVPALPAIARVLQIPKIPCYPYTPLRVMGSFRLRIVIMEK